MTEKPLETCAAEGCENTFVKRTHNMKYCSNECCQIETNKKMKAAYHERIAIKKGKARVCVQCEVTRLSRYNPGRICGSCEEANKKTSGDFLSRFASIVS